MDTFVIIVGIVTIVGLIYNRLNRDHDTGDEILSSMDESVNEPYEQTQQEEINSNQQEEMNTEKQADTAPDARGLMFRALSAIGCQPELNDEGWLFVKYQGENFSMDFSGVYVRIWDPVWASIKADDPELPKVREAVNLTNYDFGPTVVLSAPDDEGEIRFHSRRDIMLHPAFPDIDQYVRAVLDSFFPVKEKVRRNFHHIDTQQTESKKNRRPVGFTANQPDQQ